MIKAVLFDFDGTLVNTNPLIIKTFEITLKHFLPNQSFTEEQLLEFIGPTLKQTFDSLDKEKTDEMITYYRKINKELHDDMVKIYPTVKEGLKVLKAKNIMLGIVSSKKRDMVIHGLKHFDMDHFFSIIVGEDDVINPKPNPEPILKAMDMLNCCIDEVIFVGDNSHDIEGGKNSQVITCCVSWAHRGVEYLKQFNPDYILNDMRDLINIIEEVNTHGK
ncbi:pyrophosphatase PpaX [Mycoplasmatota bacterium]|nr:pyrophosphatase PpaX [Mycoplasmatota bacterium]